MRPTPAPPIHVVRLTPPGRGALATLLVAGQDAVALVDRSFHARGGRPLDEYPADRPVVGRFGRDDAGEEIVARRTAADEVLLYCHGGTAAVERIESLLVAEGAVALDWPDWAAAAHADPLQSDALVALAQAATEKTAAILLDQYQGTLRAELTAIEAALTAGDNVRAVAHLDRLLAWSFFGLHLTDPWRVVLAGPPNAGKSSLANAVLGYPRAIVHHAPGTTRDVLTARAAVEGWPVELVDTAGLTEGSHPVEAEGIRRAWDQIATADAVVLVFDRSQPFSQPEQSLLARAAACRVRARTHGPTHPTLLVVHNKSDLPPAPGDRPEGIATSALSAEGLPELLRSIGRHLVPESPAPGQAVPWTQRQIDFLANAQAALAESAPARAAAVLQEL